MDTVLSSSDRTVYVRSPESNDVGTAVVVPSSPSASPTQMAHATIRSVRTATVSRLRGQRGLVPPPRRASASHRGRAGLCAPRPCLEIFSISMRTTHPAAGRDASGDHPMSLDRQLDASSDSTYLIADKAIGRSVHGIRPYHRTMFILCPQDPHLSPSRQTMSTRYPRRLITGVPHSGQKVSSASSVMVLPTYT